MRIILASGSPRRRQLLAAAGIEFDLCEVQIDESALPGECAEQLVCRLAALKAAAAARLFPGRLCLGADTLVVCDEEILGKPADMAQAEAMLLRLSGRSHSVFTGVSLQREWDLRLIWQAETRVRFKALDLAGLRAYLALVNPLDKAGAYAIQEHGERLIEDIEGLRSNVVGLPIEQVQERLQEIMAADRLRT